ncbi:hypothetical protein H4R19_005224, partial [Coemansia spiralis]
IRPLEPMSHERWAEAEEYIAYLARQLAVNSPLTGNLGWAMFHYVVHMRCLKTVDFLCDVDSALGNLQLVLHIVLRGLCAVLTADEQSRVLADRPIASGTVDLIVDKARALENGEVRAHAFRQAQADPTPLRRQVLHYTVLAISRLDLHRLPAQHAFYRAQLAMLADMFAPQAASAGSISSARTYPSVLARELLETVGPSAVFDAAQVQAEEAVHALLLHAIDAPPAHGPAQGLVQSAYSYLFSRGGSDAQSRATEQLSLLALLLLVAQPVHGADNPFLRALAAVGDRPEGAPRIDSRVPFRRLFEKAVAGVASVEWAALLHTLVARNEAFRTYVLARTDTDTLLLPLLSQISQATAVPIPAPSSTSSSAAASHGAGPRRPSAQARSGDGSTAPAYATVVAEPGAKSPNPAATSTRTPSGSPSTAAAQLWGGAPRPHPLTADSVPYVQLYLWMDILLALSEDAQFVEQLQRATVEFWPATPQPMHGQPQAHCIVVEMARIFQLNLMALKDEHLNGLALGIMVNVLGRSTMVTTGIAQKLLKLFEMILKRYTRLQAQPRPAPSERAEQAAYEGALSVLMSLFSCLAYTNNPHFIYGLLQARDVLAAFGAAAGAPALAQARLIAADLRVRIAYFHARIAALSSPQAKAILALIETVVATETHHGRPRVDFISSVPDGEQWSDFMVPLAWGLLAASPATAVAARPDAPLLEAFERLVL